MKKSPYLSLHQVSKLRLVPWALGRNKLAELFQTNQIKNIRGGTAKQPRYLTTKEWVQAYVDKKLHQL